MAPASRTARRPSSSRRDRTVFRCTSCTAQTPVWAGRCRDCGEWNSLVEVGDAAVPSPSPDVAARPITELVSADVDARPTGVRELDRVLGGGLVPGSVTVLGGEPGIGKSTLVLQALAASTVPTLYATAEESAAQVRARAERLGALVPNLWLCAETDLHALLAQVAAVEPSVLVVDSIQTIFDPDVSSAPGSVGQVRDCAHRLVTEARARGCAVVLVGHVTKEGALAGPRVLEHLVDTVLTFEGDRHHSLRLLRAVKHRHGGTGQLGVFEMTERGLVDVDDPSALFLADRRAGAAGSVVVPVLDGGRPLLVELQALLAPSAIPTPRRQAQGLESGRLGMLLAVLAQRVGLGVADQDVWVTVAGGIRAAEPAVDLGVALAVASAATGVPVPADLVACGEVGLAGEVRQVGRLDRRLAEADRLGFRRVLVPASAPEGPAGCRLLRVRGLSEALLAAGMGGSARPGPRSNGHARPPRPRSGPPRAG